MFTVLGMNWDKQCIDGCCYCTLNDVQRNLRIEDIIKKRSKRFTPYMYDRSLPVELYCACIRPYWDTGFQVGSMTQQPEAWLVNNQLTTCHVHVCTATIIVTTFFIHRALHK